MTIQNQLAKSILAWGGTDRELARKAGIPPSTICRFMKGKTITLDSAAKLCMALGLKLECKRW